VPRLSMKVANIGTSSPRLRHKISRGAGVSTSRVSNKLILTPHTSNSTGAWGLPDDEVE